MGSFEGFFFLLSCLLLVSCLFSTLLSRKTRFDDLCSLVALDHLSLSPVETTRGNDISSNE